TKCMPGGGYAFDNGNTVVNYTPVKNYIAMLDEGMQLDRY
ncbi:MAG: uroporphyrinogen-III decarboxylase-like protein, partial [Planctomycetes bacterium]|nr:uroporphyrinogen-III decarboxylase-like protein [Planctomycetota bacterium]